MILEIACFNLDSAIIAQQAGADRIELCEDYQSGGYSPAISTLTLARELIKIPVHVMIRPRPDAFGHPFIFSPPGNFIYSEMEIQWMIQYILACKFSGIDGIVLGALTPQKEIDLNTLKRCIEAAGTMNVTFHRAIDECENVIEAAGKLVGIGCHRILTSGGKKNALDGKKTINELQKIFNGKIIILPGGGIRSTNISEIIRETNCSEYHSAAFIKDSAVCDDAEIRKLKEILNSF